MATPGQAERKKKKKKNKVSDKLPDLGKETKKKENSLENKKSKFPCQDDAGRKKKKQKLHLEEGEISGKRSGSKKNAQNSSLEGNKVITDERFASAHSDPRFQRMPHRDVKVSIDSRFNRLFSDKSYASSSAPVDKRGKLRKNKGENLLSQYYLREDDVKSVALEDYEKEAEELEEFDGSYADSVSSSSSDDDEVDDYKYGDDSEGWKLWMVNQEEAPMIEEETCRIAVVNLDWDHIRAVDIYVMMSSTLLTCPQSGGQVLSVTIYPSEFGIKCMEIEAIRGPYALIDGGDDGNDDDEENNDEMVNEKIRSYQLQRLRYYYAVVECDSSGTANHLYSALDGVEFLRSANVLDLRFIPDSMVFPHSPRDVATEAPADYKQPDFETTALQHSSVKLTWDDDEPKRKKILRRKFNADQMDELEQYLASEDSEEEQEEEEQDRYRNLLHDDDGNDEDHEDDDDDDDDDDGKKEMEVTFLPGVENLSKHIEKSKLKKSEESVWAAALRKKREKNKARKIMDDDDDDDEEDGSDNDREIPDGNDDDDDFFAEGGEMTRVSKDRRPVVVAEGEATAAELELLLTTEDTEGEHLKGFNLRPKKKKNKNKEMPVAVDKLPKVDAAADPRFLSRLSSSLYSLDPTDPQFKRSAVGMRQEHSKRKTENDSAIIGSREDNKGGSLVEEKLGKEKHEIMSLVRSLKVKSQVLRENTRER